MLCIRCGKSHNGTYGQRCEDCWSIGQAATEIIGIPYVSGLGERRRKKKIILHPETAALLCGNFVKI